MLLPIMVCAMTDSMLRLDFFGVLLLTVWAEKFRFCEQIHQHALDYAKNSKLSKSREYLHKINDTMTVNMRLIGPMAMALGVSWNIVEPNEIENRIDYRLVERNPSQLFDTPLRTKRPFQPNMKTVCCKSLQRIIIPFSLQ